MFNFLLVVQILVSISIIALVMLQQGKGADMGAAFGSGASGTVFGSGGSGSFFTSATGILAAVFFVNCLLIASPLVRDTGKATESIAEQIERAEQVKATTALEELTPGTQDELQAIKKGAAKDVTALEDVPSSAGDLPDAGGESAPRGPGDLPE